MTLAVHLARDAAHAAVDLLGPLQVDGLASSLAAVYGTREARAGLALAIVDGLLALDDDRRVQLGGRA